MNITQCIQLVFSGALALATIALALITLGYLIATNKMAGYMNRQSEIMQKEFEIRLMPLVEEKISRRVTTGLKPTANLTISNKGFYPVFCSDIEMRLENDENRDDFVIDHMNIGEWLKGGSEINREMSFDFGRLSSFSRNPNISGKAIAKMTFNYRNISDSALHQTQLVRY